MTKQSSGQPVAQPTAPADPRMATAKANAQAVVDTFTQRDWIQVTGALNMTRHQVVSDLGFAMVAAAWVQHKRQHGGASWDEFLDMTDAQLIARFDDSPIPSQ
jgi:hypothetical protein